MPGRRAKLRGIAGALLSASVVACDFTPSAKPSTPTAEQSAENVARIRALFEAINERREGELIRELAAPQFVRHDLTGAIPGVTGQDGAARFIESLRAAFPDLKLEIQDAIADCDTVVVRFVARGTQSGPFLGQAPTNRRVEVNNINIYRFESGRVVETWQLTDGYGLLRQIDSLP